MLNLLTTVINTYKYADLPSFVLYDKIYCRYTLWHKYTYNRFSHRLCFNSVSRTCSWQLESKISAIFSIDLSFQLILKKMIRNRHTCFIKADWRYYDILKPWVEGKLTKPWQSHETQKKKPKILQRKYKKEQHEPENFGEYNNTKRHLTWRFFFASSCVLSLYWCKVNIMIFFLAYIFPKGRVFGRPICLSTFMSCFFF